MNAAPARRGKRLTFEFLETRNMLAFGVTTGATPTGQSTYVIDNGADLKFAVIRGGSLSSTIHLGDVSSIQYKGAELLAPYSSTSRYSHYEQGLGSTTGITYTVDPSNSWILVVCDDSSNGVIQYYAVRNGDNNIYMSSYVTAGGEGRFLAYLNRGVFIDVEEPSNIAGNVGAVEGSDVFYLADGTTRSKYYNTRRMIENEYHGVTGFVGRSPVGAWMFMGNRENSSGGPFFKDIDLQTTGGAVELYNVIYSGHTQTEPYRYGMYGPYALQITDGSPPIDPDYSWMDDLGIPNLLPASARGSVSGVASGMVSGHQTVIALSNSGAQYWTIADAATGAYSIEGIEPGAYTMTMYDQELAVGTRMVTIAAQSNLLADISNTYYLPEATWRIGTWDGTPAGFLNAEKIAIMHPVDVRMSPWVDTNFIVGTNTDADWPMAQFKDVNNGQRITFNLSAAQAATAQTLRIGITLGFSGGRNLVTVNAGQAGEWTSSIPAASTNLHSRGITRGTYRGPNQVYTYNIPTSALHAGVNTIDLPVVSGSAGSGFLSPNVVYDAIDLVPTASLTNAPRVQTIMLSPSTAQIGVGGQVDFVAEARDQFGNPIPANINLFTTAGVIDQQGHYTAPFLPGGATITAASGSISATATVTAIAAPELLGDYNGDNVVDAADYTAWRDSLGQDGLTPFSGADGSGNGAIGTEDYAVWKSHFGQMLSGTAAGAGSIERAIADPLLEVLQPAPTASAATTVVPVEAISTASRETAPAFISPNSIRRDTAFRTAARTSSVRFARFADDQLLLMLAIDHVQHCSPQVISSVDLRASDDHAGDGHARRNLLGELLAAALSEWT
jgi:rhamnogalacturonan endolyase